MEIIKIKDWSGMRSNGVIYSYSNGYYYITHRNGKVEKLPESKFKTVEELYKYVDNIKDSVKDSNLGRSKLKVGQIVHIDKEYISSSKRNDPELDGDYVIEGFWYKGELIKEDKTTEGVRDFSGIVIKSKSTGKRLSVNRFQLKDECLHDSKGYDIMQISKDLENRRDSVKDTSKLIKVVKKVKDVKSVIGSNVKYKSLDNYVKGKVTDVIWSFKGVQLVVEALEGPAKGQHFYKDIDEVKVI